MQFLATHNSADAYNNLAESNIIHQDSSIIHQPPSVQGNALFRNNFSSKNPMDQFDYKKHMLDNFLDPVHNDQVVHSTSFINTRNSNPYTNGEAGRFFSYNDSIPYANNYGATDYWDPYQNPGKNIEAYLRHQTIKPLDKTHHLDNAMQNINTFYPRNINPKNDFLKNFNPSDNFITGKNNFNIQNGNDIPLNVMHPNPTNMATTIKSNDVMNLSLKDLIYNLGKNGMDIINDLVKYSVDGGGPNGFFSIFTKNDRIAYTGIYIIIITILMMILI